MIECIPTATLSERTSPDPFDNGRRELVVNVIWEVRDYAPNQWLVEIPLDRPNVGGWIFTLSQRNLAERLVRAINAGKVYKNPEIKRDIGGKSYVSAETTEFFHKRYMRRSLEKVGF